MKTQFHFFRSGLLIGLIIIMSACIQQDNYMDEPVPEEGITLKKATVDPLDLTDRYIVTFRSQVSNPVAEAARLKGIFGFETGHVYEHALKGFSAKIPPQALNGLRNHPLIELIEPDQIQSVNAQTIPTGIRRIGTLLNNRVPINGVEDRPDVDIAVIDTGIDKEHPDLLVSGGIQYYNMGLESTNYDDDHGHGSHVAGTIAARDNTIGVVGVVPGARLWAVKVLSSTGRGYTSDIIKGIDWVTARAATIEVVNMSIGGAGYSSNYRTALANCVARGVVVMVAAGNEATDVYGADRTFGTSDDRVPAAYPEVATISAFGDSDGLPGGTGPNTSNGRDDSFATFSNYSYSVVAGNPVNSPGKAIDLILPGVNIYSAYKDMNYAWMSGTSMACPHAAGLAALYIVEKGRASDANGVKAIRQALIDAAWPQSDTTYGLVNGGDPDPNKEKLGWAVFGSTPPPPNQAPVADAGPDQTVRDADGSGGELVSLNGSGSTDDNGITSWKWELGGTTIGNASAFNYTFPVGQNIVTLTVTDAGNLSSTDEVVITVQANQAPVANAGSDQAVRDTDGSGGEPVSLNGSGSTDDSGITSWKWELGGTTIGTASAFNYTFPVGQNIVTLTVTDAGNLSSTDQVTINVLANQAPVANFSFVTNGLQVTFTDGSTDDGTITAWSWDFGDGSSSTVRNPVKTYGAGGTYDVRLIVTDNGLATSSVTKTVTVSPPADPVIQLSAVIYRLNKVQWAARLTWSGATTANVDVYMNGNKVITTINDGDHVINLGKTLLPSYTFRVCNAGSNVCSPVVTVSN